MDPNNTFIALSEDGPYGVGASIEEAFQDLQKHAATLINNTMFYKASLINVILSERK